ncbi:hypothetical protein LBJG_01664 [Lactobacillus jensenii 1153]|nr:hypothetical protein LBJG_01664 [Lactobacillus jensenii 1153]
MKQKMREKIKKIDYWLVAILILAAFLYGWNIWKAGYANQFYTAAIVSMSKSWKAFGMVVLIQLVLLRWISLL